jgi:uncharacterized protein (DUF58 family)
MLPAELAREVKRIQFVTGRQVANVMAGAYLSVFKGRGMEFDEVRPYVPGDDVRTIDWNVTARTGEPYVKRFVEERELTVMLLVDVSASQDFGSGRRSKLEAAVELSALLALSAIANATRSACSFHGGADLTSRRARAPLRAAGSARCQPRLGEARGRGGPGAFMICRDVRRFRKPVRPREPGARPASAAPSSAARCCRGARWCSWSRTSSTRATSRCCATPTASTT